MLIVASIARISQTKEDKDEEVCRKQGEALDRCLPADLNQQADVETGSIQNVCYVKLSSVGMDGTSSFVLERGGRGKIRKGS